MEQKDKPWVVNYPEAVNRTCNAIYEEYKVLIELFNKKLCDACSKKKHETAAAVRRDAPAEAAVSYLS